jgi:adenylate cyclase
VVLIMGNADSRLRGFLGELRRRKVYRVAVVYAVVAFVIWQAAEIAFPALNLPAWTLTFVVVLTLVGFPIALVLAWAFDITPGGVQRTAPVAAERGAGPGRRGAMAAFAAGVVVAVAAGAVFFLSRGRPQQQELPYPVGEAKPAIAVLPFENISPNPQDAYFADGMHEQITSQLSQVSAIRVISRTSVMPYREERKPVRDIAAELGVNYVLEGSARKAEDRVRLTVQLIDADRDEHVWAEEYDRDLTAAHLFEIQSEVAERVASALEVELTTSERQRIERHPTESLAAYDLYLLGRYYWNQLDAEGLERAVEYFEGALDLDPDFALAYSGLADTYMIQTQGWGLAPRDVFPKAREAATRALELDPALAEAHASLGHVRLFYDWDWDGAEAAFERAIEVNPNYAPAPHWLAMCLMARARYTEAIQAVQQALALDPQSPYVKMNVGYILYVSRQYEQALEAYSDALEAQANAVIRALRGGVYVQQGRFDEGISDIELAAERLEGRNLIPAAYLGFAYARAGRRNDAERVLRELQEISAERFVNPDYMAIVHMGLGQNDQAIEWLYRATEARTDWPVFFPVDPVTDSIRSDPRYQELLRRVGLSELIE